MPEAFAASGTNDASFPAGSADRSAASEEIASPSGSDALTVTVTVLPSAIGVVAGAVTAGARSTFVTAIEVVALPAKTLPAVKVTRYGPGAASNPGVHVNVPLALPASGVKVAPAGRPLAPNDVIGWPSGSDAVTVNDSPAFSVALAAAGAATTGGRSTVIDVVTMLPASAFAAWNVTE